MAAARADATPRFRATADAAAWLKGRPPALVTAMAARAALRAGPLLAEPSRAPRDAAWREEVVLPWLRAVALALRGAELLVEDARPDAAARLGEAAVAAAVAAQRSADVAHAAAERALGVSRAAERADGAGRAARAAAGAAYAVKRAAYENPSARGRAAGAAARNLSEHEVLASEADADFVESGGDAAGLLDRPLWPGGGAPPSWTGVRARLLSADRRWAVWTDWWEARALGGDRPAMRDLPRIVAESDLPWGRGADAVNDVLARLAVERGLPWLAEPAAPGGAPDDEAAEHDYAPEFEPFDPPPPTRIAESEPDPALREALGRIDAAARMTLAARAALRALPAVVRPLEWDPEDRRGGVVLPTFRAAATAWTAARSAPRGGLEQGLRAAAAGASNIDSAAARAAACACSADAWAALAHAADAASGVARALSPDALPKTMGAVSSASVGRAAQREIEDATAADAAAIARDGRPQSLAAAPLWPDGAPGWARAAWSRLSDALAAADEGWEVWTGWYEARLGGEAGDPQAERARVALPEAVWSLPAAEANAEIARAVAGDLPEWVELLVAARGLIRLLPLAARSLKRDSAAPLVRAKLVLPAFRTAAALWAAAQSGERRKALEATSWSAAAIATSPSDARLGHAVAALAQALETRRLSRVVPGAAYEFARDALEAAMAADVAAARVGGTRALAAAPLWPQGFPGWWSDNEGALNHSLKDTDEDWPVWLDWLRARVEGRPADIAFELEKVSLQTELWRDGPAVVNAEIARMIAEREGAAAPEPPPEAPPERPAPVHFEMRDGALRPAPPLADAERPGFVAAARAGIAAAADDLLAAGAGRQNPRLATVLGRLREALGADPEGLDAMALGVCAGRLSAQAARADETLMPQDAAELVALDIELQRFLAHLPEWRAYVDDVARGFDAPEVEQAAVADAAAAMAAIAGAAPDLIAEDAATSLAELRDAATPDPSPDDPAPLAPALARRSYLRAARSALRALAAHALGPVARGACKGVEKAAEGAAFAAAGVGVVAGLSALAARLPSEFGWLAAVVGHIARLVGLA